MLPRYLCATLDRFIYVRLCWCVDFTRLRIHIYICTDICLCSMLNHSGNRTNWRARGRCIKEITKKISVLIFTLIYQICEIHIRICRTNERTLSSISEKINHFLGMRFVHKWDTHSSRPKFVYFINAGDFIPCQRDYSF